MTLAGKVAIITGGSRGIGRAIGQGLAQAGAEVVVAARTERDVSAGADFARYAAGDIHATAARIRQAGGAALAVPCDVANPEEIRALVDTTLNHYGRLDIMVSNAGIDCESRVVDLDPEVLDRCLAVNVRAPLLLCKYAPARFDGPRRRRHYRHYFRFGPRLPGGTGRLLHEQGGSGADAAQFG